MLIWFEEPIDFDRMSLIRPPRRARAPGRRRSRRSRGGGLQEHPAGAGLPDDLVRDRRPHHRDLEHLPASELDALGDRRRHLLRLAVADADATGAVAHDDERGERGAGRPSTFATRLMKITRSSYGLFSWSLESYRRAIDPQSSLSRTLGDRGDPAVEAPAAAIEHDPIDPGALRPVGDQLADLLGARELASRVVAVAAADLGVEAAASVVAAASSISWT